VSVRDELNAQDLESLARRYITPEWAQRGRFSRVDTHEGARLIGRNGGGDYAGIIIPNILPGEGRERERRLRRDRPDLEEKEGGGFKEKGKYLSPPGRSNLAYFPPGTPPEYLSDYSVPAYIPEGEFKGLALYRFLNERCERGFVMALQGVWSWKGTVGKTTDEKGRRDIKGVIPDFDRVTWKGRVVYIIFDSDVATNEKVRAARREFAKELKRRGADVRLVNLPQIEGAKGVDDLLALKGPEFVASLIADAESPESVESPPRKSQASSLIGLADGAELFHAPDSKTFATVEVNGHRETLPLRSTAFRDWLSHKFYLSEKTVPSAAALQDALSALAGRARFDGAEIETFVRIAGHGGCIYLDLCDRDWRVVKITAEGWEVVGDSPVKFRRARGMLALPSPKRGGSVAELRRFVNVGTDSDFTLLLGWLVAAFRPRGPYPVLALHGEQGSAKSTAARLVRALVDPNAAALRSEPREDRDLMIAATNGWCVAFDNLSKIPLWLSDGLCRLATGGGFTTRELYTNDDEVLFDVQRPSVLNGIEEVATRPDLLDRSIILSLPAIPEERRMKESALWREFEAERPVILGALLDAVSAALRNEPHIILKRLPRMADFAVWAAAAEPAMGIAEGAFMAAYERNRAAANDLALEASPVAVEVLKCMAGRDTWTVTYTDLLTHLERAFGDSPKRPEGWPKSARGLSGELTRVAVNLRKAGVDVAPAGREGGGGRKMVTLARLEQPCEQSSQRSQRPQPGETAGDPSEHCGGEEAGHSQSSQQHSQSNTSRSEYCEGCERGECEIHAFSSEAERANFVEAEGFFGDRAAEEAGRREREGYE
jgi:hypothetical protein